MKVELNLPDKAFWRLAAEAEQFGMSTAELIADLTLVSIRRIPEGQADPVVVRWRKGWPDKQIAAELNMTNSAVAFRRRKYGLPANTLRGVGKQIRKSA